MFTELIFDSYFKKIKKKSRVLCVYIQSSSSYSCLLVATSTHRTCDDATTSPRSQENEAKEHAKRISTHTRGRRHVVSRVTSPLPSIANYFAFSNQTAT